MLCSYNDLLLAVRLSAYGNFCSTACVVHCDEVLLCHTIPVSTVTSESVGADWTDWADFLSSLRITTLTAALLPLMLC